MWNRVQPWLGSVVRLVLGVVWIWAAWEKLKAPRQFVQAVRAYDATPEWLSKAIGYGLPVLEFALGVLLVLGFAVRIAAIVSAALFLVFLVGIVQAAARGIQLDCGCFGGGGETQAGTTYTLDILRDIGLLALAVYLVVWTSTRISVDEFLARNDHVETPSAKRLRTEQGRRKYSAMVELKRKEALSRSRYVNASVAGIVVLIAVIGIGVQSNRAKIEGSLTATHASVASGVVFGKKAAATIDIYEDFQCPICQKFETSVGPTLEAAARANKAQLRFHMMNFLDADSNGNRYSTRAANAALCASDISVDAFFALHKILYLSSVQPKEGSNGRTDKQLITYAQRAKISGANLTTFTTCVNTEEHKALVEAITERASEDGVTGTPTVLVNGKSVDTTVAAVTAAIDKALVKGPKPSPSVTPSPSASPSPSPSPSPSASASTKPAASSTKPAASSSTPGG